MFTSVSISLWLVIMLLAWVWWQPDNLAERHRYKFLFWAGKKPWQAGDPHNPHTSLIALLNFLSHRQILALINFRIWTLIWSLPESKYYSLVILTDRDMVRILNDITWPVTSGHRKVRYYTNIALWFDTRQGHYWTAFIIILTRGSLEVGHWPLSNSGWVSFLTQWKTFFCPVRQNNGRVISFGSQQCVLVNIGSIFCCCLFLVYSLKCV